MTCNRTQAGARTGAAAGAGVALTLGCILLCAGCDCDSGPTRPQLAPRTYRMGFASVPPRADLALILQTIDLFAQRADAALISGEPPWDSLLAGRRPDSLIIRNQLGLASYFRGKGLRVVVSIDATNGLDRSSDAAQLVAAGRSLTEPAIQQLYRDWCVAMDTLVQPDVLALAMETNLIRAAAPTALYAAVVQAANDAAADVRAADPSRTLCSTVQVETAWGRLVPGGAYQGIAQDRADFAFMDVLGLSSYPYLGGFAAPESLPPDYYSRLIEPPLLPVMVLEGGWASDSLPGIPSTRDEQRRYVERHARLLDGVSAAGWFQITFTDLDLATWPPAVAPFASLGMVDVNLQPKPALAAWDAVFARVRR